jgi:hypothetical protein
MEITESQLQILALAEEVERLQGLVASEKAANDELRRRFLKMSAPRRPPDTDLPTQGTERPQVDSETQPLPTAPSDSAAISGQPEHVSVVGRAQQARQAAALADHSQRSAGQQRKRGFSLWGFITGEDRIGI